MSKPLRILLADDHALVREGLRRLLEAREGWVVCGEAATGREVIQKARELRPDLIVLDISMPELNGIEAARQVMKSLPRVEVLILTMHESEQMAAQLLAAGVRGYVLKSDAGSELVAAVEALARHEPHFTPRIAQWVLEGYLQGQPAAKAVRSLTKREAEVAQLLAEGKANKEVAVALGVSVKTAETHRANIMRKLNLHSLADLVHYAIRNQIIQP